MITSQPQERDRAYDRRRLRWPANTCHLCGKTKYGQVKVDACNRCDDGGGLKVFILLTHAMAPSRWQEHLDKFSHDGRSGRDTQIRRSNKGTPPDRFEIFDGIDSSSVERER